MAQLVAFIAVALCAAGCRTSAPPTEVPSAAESGAQEVAGVAGPFEVAEAWIASGGAPGAPQPAELLRTFSQPVVERMHRTDVGFAALVIDAGSASAAGPGEGILLTLREVDGAWRVVSNEIVAADYLWPSQ